MLSAPAGSLREGAKLRIATSPISPAAKPHSNSATVAGVAMLSHQRRCHAPAVDTMRLFTDSINAGTTAPRPIRVVPEGQSMSQEHHRISTLSPYQIRALRLFGHRSFVGMIKLSVQGSMQENGVQSLPVVIENLKFRARGVPVDV